jgi:hypothetical protein
MNIGHLFTALEAVTSIRDAAKRFKGPTPAAPDAHQPPAPSAQPPGGQMEARLTSVVVAALKEAFDRDHARMQLERTHLEEERRRAEQLLNIELRRQAVDRELSRLRLLAGAAMVGWIASIVMFALRAASTSTGARIMVAAGWLLLLGALAAAFNAQPKVTAAEGSTAPGSTAAVWMLVAGLGITAASLLF